jgi:hypothetical protein
VPHDSAEAGVAASCSIRSSHANDPRIMAIIPEFVDGLPGIVRTMIDLLERNDLPALEKIAHRLLGTCGGYGLCPSFPARPHG